MLKNLEEVIFLHPTNELQLEIGAIIINNKNKRLKNIAITRIDRIGLSDDSVKELTPSDSGLYLRRVEQQFLG